MIEAGLLALAVGGFLISTYVAIQTRTTGRPFQATDVPPPAAGPFAPATLKWKAWLAAGVIAWSALPLIVLAVFPHDSIAAWALLCLVVAAGAVWFWTSIGRGRRT